MADADVKEVLVLHTDKDGNKFSFVRQGRVAHIAITDSEGDEVETPKGLIGGWTDSKNAQTAVNSYLAKLAKEAKAAPAKRVAATKAK